MPANRIRESLEGAFAQGNGQAMVFVDCRRAASRSTACAVVRRTPLDGRTWQQLAFSNQMVCDECGRVYPPPEPRLYSFNSPLGACPECEGFGNVIDIDMDLIVPDPRKSLREGAIAPWNTPAYAHELEELIALAGRLRHSARCAVQKSHRTATPTDSRRSAGAEVRRPARIFRLAGTQKIQNAPPRVSQPLAKLSDLPRVQRRAIAARGVGDASWRAEHRSSVRS